MLMTVTRAFIFSLTFFTLAACSGASSSSPETSKASPATGQRDADYGAPAYGARLPDSLSLDVSSLGAFGGEQVVYDQNNPPVTLPVINDSYQEDDGCYLACYSHDKENASYKLSEEDIYVMGLYRVKGQYAGRICQPSADGEADISAIDHYKEACAKVLPKACHEGELNCWVGGDTGGFFGQQGSSDPEGDAVSGTEDSN